LRGFSEMAGVISRLQVRREKALVDCG